MTLCLALILLTTGDLPTSLSESIPEPMAEPMPEPKGAPLGDHVLLRVRGGAWTTKAFEFDAITTSSTQLRSTADTLASFGFDGGGSVLNDRIVVFGSIEGSYSSKIHSENVGLCIGWRDWAPSTAAAGIPNEVILYAGAMYGRFDITTSGFGDFDNTLGARAGISLYWKLTPIAGISLLAEYRYMKFDYKDKSSILSGDTSIGGSGLWIGMGIDFRF